MRVLQSWSFLLVVASAAAAPLAAQNATALAPPADTSSAIAYRTFGANFLFAALRARGADSNTVVSPVSAATALSLLWMGARGATADSMAAALGFLHLDRTQVAERNAAFMDSASHRTDVTLDLANAVWLNVPNEPSVEFEGIARGPFRALVAQVALSTPSAVPPINHWADSVTHGKISKILDAPLPTDAVMLLANAVYFKGKWARTFDKAQTGDADFDLGTGARVRVPFMHMTGVFAYARRAGYQVLRVPYQTGRAAMYFVLPDPGQSLGDVEQRLRADGWPSLNSSRGLQEVSLALPKLHEEQTLDLGPVLRAMGMGIALDRHRADFSGLVRDPARAGIFLAKATQNVYLDVDEEGTTAAAVTTGVMMPTAVRMTIRFVLDRPFLFLLRDEVSGADLFAGWIAHP